MSLEEDQSVRLRPATSEDQEVIKALIHEAGINPLGLKWERFVVAEADSGLVVGCAQLKDHRDGSVELASLAVAAAWRGRGIGGRLIRALIERADQTLWLMCRSGLVPFYEPFGFRAVGVDEPQPPYFRRIRKLARLFRVLARRHETLAVMSRTRSSS